MSRCVPGHVPGAQRGFNKKETGNIGNRLRSDSRTNMPAVFVLPRIRFC